MSGTKSTAVVSPDGLFQLPVQKGCACVLSRVQLFCDHMDCSPPGSPVHEISPAGILQWVAISFSRKSSQSRNQTQADSLLSEPPGKPNSEEGFLFIHTLSTSIICRYFNDGHSHWCEVTPHFCFDLYFSNN